MSGIIVQDSDPAVDNMVRYLKGKLILMDTHNRRLVSLSLRRAIRLLLASSCCLLFVAFTQAQDLTFSVPATSGRNWFDTGLDIAPGTLLRLAARDEVDVGAGRIYGPRGTRQFADGPGYPAETRYRYGLVARLTARPVNPGQSEDGLYEQWSYGDLPGDRYCAGRGGHLWFTVNDNSPDDNSGAFTVILTRATCPSEVDDARVRVNLYTADNNFFRPASVFRVGDTVVLKLENNTRDPIYLRSARDTVRLIREEGLQVERLNGSRYVPVLPSGRAASSTDEVRTDNGNGISSVTATGYGPPLTDLIELRATMNITRRWTVVAPNVPGSYRLSLVYYHSRDTQRPPVMIYSSTFEVAR